MHAPPHPGPLNANTIKWVWDNSCPKRVVDNNIAVAYMHQLNKNMDKEGIKFPQKFIFSQGNKQITLWVHFLQKKASLLDAAG